MTEKKNIKVLFLLDVGEVPPLRAGKSPFLSFGCLHLKLLLLKLASFITSFHFLKSLGNF